MGVIPWLPARRLAGVFLAVTMGLLPIGCGGEPTAESRVEQRAERVSRAIDRALGTDPRFEAVLATLVVADGVPLVERYDGTTPEEFHPVQSVTKSVLSTLVGIAVDEELLALDDTLGELLPAYVDRMRLAVARVSLRELLTMSGGFLAEEDPDGLLFATADDAVATALSSSRGPAGFAYSNAGAHVLAAVLAEATGKSVLAYAREKLFDPLAVDTEPAFEPLAAPANLPAYVDADFAWPVDRQGLHHGWGLLKLRPQDMVNLGQLYLAGGQWEGQQVVSEDWVTQATHAQVDVGNPSFGSYGYLWWVEEIAGREAYMAAGYGGQLIVVVPELDLVSVVVTELNPDDLSSELDPVEMETVVDVAVAAGFGRK